MNNYRDFITEEFETRKMINKNYSLRSFARDLEVESSHLSRIIGKKRGLSNEKARVISKKLGLKGKELELFFALIEKEHGKNKQAKYKATKFLQTTKKYSKLDLGLFQLISDWKYFAILAAMQLDHYTGLPDWISGNLNIPLEQVDKCIKHLMELNFVEKKRNKYFATVSNLETDTDIPSAALKKAHKQSILQAIEAINQFDVDQRDISSMTMAIDIKKLPEAKRKIANFNKELCEFLESGKKNNVFNINVQLYPLSGKENSQ